MAYLGKTISPEMHFGASPLIKQRAKELRKRMTRAEKILWQALRGNGLQKLHFRRQHPAWRFILDFYCHEIRLAIEVDGSVHLKKERRERDLNRTAELERLGITVLRFTNDEVIWHKPQVTRTIVSWVAAHFPDRIAVSLKDDIAASPAKPPAGDSPTPPSPPGEGERWWKTDRVDGLVHRVFYGVEQ